LAEAELEYDNNHQCTAAFVKMPFVRLPFAVEQHPVMKALGHLQVSALVWTTTPWTLPANQAIAVNSGMSYSIISLSDPNTNERTPQDLLLVTSDRVQHVLEFLAPTTEASIIVDNLSGMEVADATAACFNPFQGTESAVVTADFVTSSSGTGVVHMAPGHGMEDYQVCQEHRIGSAFAPVDDDGRFTGEVFPNAIHEDTLKGLDVQTDGVQAVIDTLSKPRDHFRHTRTHAHEDGFSGSLVLASHPFVHKNPIDWRTKKPVIVRATAQWFADVSAIKDRALHALDNVEFIPEGGKTRLRSFVEGRNQWCISRQRAWGVPIPVLYHRETGETCVREESINHIIETIRRKGTDAWFSDPTDDPSWIHPSLAENPWVRGKDTMDVWFDSGTTWTTLSNSTGEGMPASDVYLEGTDQHRGWFQSSLLTHVATQDSDVKSEARAPFKQLVTHGFTLDGDGRKMSKSLGNVISPDQILDGSLLPPVKAKKQKGRNKEAASATADNTGPKYDAMGPDVLRLWVASSDYTRDVSISVPVLQSVQQALQKYRVTFKFLLGVLADYDPMLCTPESHESDLTFADRAVLLQLRNTSDEVCKAYDEYKFYKAVNEINVFVNADLSAFYFEVIKDAMYAGSKDVRTRTQAVLKQIFDGLLRMLSPITPHLVEEVWEHRPAGMKEDEHPLQRIWVELSTSPASKSKDEATVNGLETFRQLSSAVKIAQEDARTAGKLRSGLACKVEVHLPQGNPTPGVACVQQWHTEGEMADLLVVSQVALSNTHDGSVENTAAWNFEQPFKLDSGSGEGKVIVMPPDHLKCVRCWKYTAEDPEEPCARCSEVLQEHGYQKPC
jgi:isoleucyl-tRNA synthetase